LKKASTSACLLSRNLGIIGTKMGGVKSQYGQFFSYESHQILGNCLELDLRVRSMFAVNRPIYIEHSSDERSGLHGSVGSHAA
jgi:hypothetical protein